MEKEGYNKKFREDSVEWQLNAMLRIEKYIKKFFEIGINSNSDTRPENCGKNKCWLCEKLKEQKEVDVTKPSNQIRDQDFLKTVVEEHCHLTGIFRRLKHTEHKLITRSARSFFIPILFHKFSGYDCHLNLRK